MGTGWFPEKAPAQRNMLFPGLVGTRGGVQAPIRNDQPMYRLAADDVRDNDFFDVILGYIAVPNGVRVDDHGCAMLALIEASRFICPNRVADMVVGQDFLERLLQCFASVWVAASTRMIFVASVRANEDMLFELWHRFRLQQPGG